jgi:hypothetical protein
METLCKFTTKDKKRFIEKTDSDISIEILEEMMIPKELTFEEFYERYQAKHIAKFGQELTV